MVKKNLLSGKFDAGKHVIIAANSNTVIENITIYSDRQNIIDIFVNNVILYKSLIISPEDSIILRDMNLVIEPGSIVSVNAFEAFDINVSGKVSSSIGIHHNEYCGSHSRLNVDLSNYAKLEQLASKASIDDSLQTIYTVWSSEKTRKVIETMTDGGGLVEIPDDSVSVANAADEVSH